MSKQTPAYVRLFDEGIESAAIVGGKGASLVRLAVAGLPVPAGFIVTTEAYREFTAGDLDDQIQAASALPPARASAEISAAFARHELPEAVEAAVRKALPPVAVAVRSSATDEDSQEVSFAGQHDSFLNVHGSNAVLGAIRDCWASLWTERAVAYREQHSIPHRRASIAVVVQEFVAAEAAGVMFTADPMTGVRTEVTINAAWGLGEALVGGIVTPDVYVVERGGAEKSRQVSDKAVRSVAAAEGGVHEASVPDSDRSRPVLDQTQSAALARLGERIETLQGAPVDVEWCLQDGRFAIVQSRPISTVEVWNSTLQGDYLWTCGNVGEAVPNVMTPATWSLISVFAAPPIGPHPVAGNIAGRFYLNMSATMALADALGMGRVIRRSNELTFGRIPEGMKIPPLPLSAAGCCAPASAWHSRWRATPSSETKAARTGGAKPLTVPGTSCANRADDDLGGVARPVDQRGESPPARGDPGLRRGRSHSARWPLAERWWTSSGSRTRGSCSAVSMAREALSQASARSWGWLR